MRASWEIYDVYIQNLLFYVIIILVYTCCISDVLSVYIMACLSVWGGGGITL